MSAPGSAAVPFSAVVGQEEAKLALLLAAVEPRLGGVLLRGAKGSAKTTLARGLGALMAGRPFVELPLGASEERLTGSLDLAGALEGQARFQPGLLAAAHGGVLYVDEINLLADHLVDLLLDVAASGVNRVERDGFSHAHPARFVLVGSMNPEEGELRPQLLDRFGLVVEVRGLEGPSRAEALQRRLELDGADQTCPPDPTTLPRLESEELELSERLAKARPARFPSALVGAVAALCQEMGAEGLRADLAVCRAAAALAGWEGRDEATPADVHAVAPLALAHRARRDPLDPLRLDQSQLEESLGRHLPQGGAGSTGGGREGGAAEGGAGSGGQAPERDELQVGGSGDPASDGGATGQARRSPSGSLPPSQPQGELEVALGSLGEPGTAPRQVRGAAPNRAAPNRAAGRMAGSGGSGPGRGPVIGEQPFGPGGGELALNYTVQGAARRQASQGRAGPIRLEPGDLRAPRRQSRQPVLVVLAVDTSASMGAHERIKAARGAALSMLRRAYQRRDQVSVVTFGGEGATVALRPTSSVEVARARLADLSVGGRTPLAAGLRAALGVALGRRPGDSGSCSPFLAVLTDGRATAAGEGQDPLGEALAAASEVASAGVAALVLDVEAAEPKGQPLGLARRLAEAMGARYVALGELSAQGVEGAILAGAGRLRPQ